MDAAPLHLIPGLKALPRQDSLLDVDEVGRAYNAMAYSMYKYGVVANTHMTFEWNKLGIAKPDRALKTLSQFNSEIAKWLAVGKPRPNLQRIGRRQGRNAEHFYVHAHENGGRHGFHTHQICYVPAATIGEFRCWAWKRIAKMTESSEDKRGALNITSWKPSTQQGEIKRGWAAFRYIIKQLDPNIAVYDNAGRIVAARGIFKPWPVHHLHALNLSRAMCCSHNIGFVARRKAGFVSRYARGQFDEMYSGFELEEGRTAREELEKRNELRKMLDTIQF